MSDTAVGQALPTDSYSAYNATTFMIKQLWGIHLTGVRLAWGNGTSSGRHPLPQVSWGVSGLVPD
jgi:hypothetical protein